MARWRLWPIPPPNDFQAMIFEQKEQESMKIGLLGTGYMGKTLARELAAAGHDVKVANSRGPDSIAAVRN
jgi:phosphoglycerate dehydrogenase-like enzyme